MTNAPTTTAHLVPTWFPPDYVERVYAGVLGKLIGVYLGRPVEGWTYDRISETYGEVDRYIHETRGLPLVVTDDDVSGTFTFLRALPDHGNDPGLTAEQIGQTWLNYVIERRTIFWWGGVGNSTEHTAYTRLKQGIPAPASGSIARNGKLIAEQIGAQIFIDGWGMICPGDPERAADFARRAASVSHDGEAIYGAQVIAALVAQAFVESDLGALLDTAVSLLPADSTIARLIADIRAWHAAEPDWRATREKIEATYGYDTYRGPCHIVPNHALIILALLYGDGDFRKSLTIVNTAGWDTDCNAGNVGAILGVKNGLAGIDASPYDWRGPVADRLYLATADGGRAITDAVIETYEVVNIARALVGEAPLRPKDGARFHFSLPGSVQGFVPSGPGVSIDNVEGQGEQGERSLAIRWEEDRPDDPVATTTPTFIPPEAIATPGYTLLASPTLYPGQEARARVAADPGNSGPVEARLLIRFYGEGDDLQSLAGSPELLSPGNDAVLAWRIPDLGGSPVAAVGLALEPAAAGAGAVYLDWLTWDGSPAVTLRRPESGGAHWLRAWVNGVDQFEGRWPEPYRISQNAGTGLISQGTAAWRNYRVTAEVSIALARNAGLAARVGGLRRWYALLLCDDGFARLVKDREGLTVLAKTPFAWELDRAYRLSLAVRGNAIAATINGEEVLAAEDETDPLPAGGVGLMVSEGTLSSGPVHVEPLS
jgi:ADP-ribosylglycohydrolase